MVTFQPEFGSQPHFRDAAARSVMRVAILQGFGCDVHYGGRCCEIWVTDLQRDDLLTIGFEVCYPICHGSRRRLLKLVEDLIG